MTLHVSLPKELENLVHNEVKTGLYGSASEVVREALRDFFDKMSDRKITQLSELKEDMQTRWQDVIDGKADAIDGEQFFKDMANKYDL